MIELPPLPDAGWHLRPEAEREPPGPLGDMIPGASPSHDDTEADVLLVATKPLVPRYRWLAPSCACLSELNDLHVVAGQGQQVHTTEPDPALPPDPCTHRPSWDCAGRIRDRQSTGHIRERGPCDVDDRLRDEDGHRVLPEQVRLAFCSLD